MAPKGESGRMNEKKYIEAAWNSYHQTVVPAHAPAVQFKETRQAFYAGAAILFETLLLVMDSGDEVTGADLKTMAALQTEIDEFKLELDLSVLPVGGHA